VPFETVPGLIGVIDLAQECEDPASEPFFDHIHGLVIVRSTLHSFPLFPRLSSSGETHSPFRLILERCLREILAHRILDDIRFGDPEADRRVG
jgi:hypothetical protein